MTRSLVSKSELKFMNYEIVWSHAISICIFNKKKEKENYHRVMINGSPEMAGRKIYPEYMNIKYSKIDILNNEGYVNGKYSGMVTLTTSSYSNPLKLLLSKFASLKEIVGVVF